MAPARHSAMANPVSYLIASLVVAVPLTLYLIFLTLASIPRIQRHILYMHKIHTLWWRDIDDPQYWGFAKNQVTAFSLETADGQKLYAWHILPLPTYAQHEETLISQPSGFYEDVTQSESFRLLKQDPEARLVINFHGNAGHVAQGFRPATYHALTDTSSYHLLTIDYRGFGHSTGAPTESGLIIDGTSTVDWATKIAHVSPERIVLLGQSLGTAVTASVAEYYAHDGIDFAGVVLVSGFSSITTMLSGYALAGWIPILRPLRAWPSLLETFVSRVVDKWASSQKLGNLTNMVKARHGRLRLDLIHAKNDWDIPHDEDDRLFEGAINGTLSGSTRLDDQLLAAEKAKRTLKRGKDSLVSIWEDGEIIVRQELFPWGGHNKIMTFAPVILAVLRLLESTPFPES